MFTSRDQSKRLTTLVVLLLALFGTAAWPAEGQIQRTPSGHPDLSGTYDAATLTPLVRPPEFGDNLYLSKEQADQIADTERMIREARAQASDPDREAPPEGGDGSPGAAGNVGGYNTFWTDRGTDAFSVDGKFRTSILIDPKNGRMPPMTAKARQARAKRLANRRPNDGTAWWIDEGDEPGPYDNIEERSTAERCILGFTGATPTFPSLYNNFKTIVQTEDHVMILIEMVHDARIVRLDQEHGPAEDRRWLGDSVGRWDGDTLVVETIHFHPDSQMRAGSPSQHVEERFTKLEDGNVLYRFTVDDPTTWTAPWTGEYLWRRTNDKLFEYACHEGNHSMGNILRGARLLEREAIAAKRKSRSSDG